MLPRTKKTNDHFDRFIECSHCAAVMVKNFDQHLKRQRGACDGAEGKAYKRNTDGSFSETVVKRR